MERENDIENEEESHRRHKENENTSVETNVLFFTQARDVTGLTDMSMGVLSGNTAHDCLNKLVTKFSVLAEISGCMVLALNEEYTPESTVVRDKDELAIIPPISRR